MKVFKFGGASVKDAESVKNVATILANEATKNIIVVVSAMGKTTNALEKLTDAFFYKKDEPLKILDEIKKFHFEILEGLFPHHDQEVYNEINNAFIELDWAIEGEPSPNYDFEYDQIVSVGETLSTKIVSAYLKEMGIPCKWMDARDVIKTGNEYREGKVNWTLTEQLVKKLFIPVLSEKKQVIVTQGFIGGTSENYTTTLGREGSDYSAAILAYCAGAKEVVIWKDVNGVLSADPKYFKDAVMLDQVSYQDTIELAYYGASVIHPKTIKPLQNKKIPLYVKSFLSPGQKGTIISEAQPAKHVPCFIVKAEQLLVSIFPKDFSFIAEKNMGEILNLFSDHHIKVNMMQNSAISFSLCMDDNKKKVPQLIKILQEKFKVLYNDGLELLTIRYYDDATIERLTKGKEILLEQKSRHTVQLVTKKA